MASLIVSLLPSSMRAHGLERCSSNRRSTARRVPEPVLAHEQRLLRETLESDVFFTGERMIAARERDERVRQYGVRRHGFAFRRVGQEIEIVRVFAKPLEDRLARAHVQATLRFAGGVSRIQQAAVAADIRPRSSSRCEACRPSESADICDRFIELGKRCEEALTRRIDLLARGGETHFLADVLEERNADGLGELAACEPTRWAAPYVTSRRRACSCR